MAGQQFVPWGYGGQTQHQTGPSSSTASAAPDSTFDDPSSVTVSNRRRSSNLSSSSPPVTGSDEEGSNSIVVDPLDLSSTCNNLNNNSTSSSSSGKTFITAPGRWNRTSLHSQQIATASSSNLQHSVQDQNSSDCVMATSAGNMEQPSAAVNPSAAVLSVTPLSMMGSSTAGVSGGADEAHKCDMCGKTFAVPARLTRHYRTHTGERPFVCEVCGKSFSVKENLSVHRRIHTKEKPYRCPHCGRGFEHSGKLHRHMRIHTGERPHQCTDCGKTFIQSGQLVIHMRSHTGEKPYVCTVCSKGFTCSKQLKVHSRTHTGERPYACDVCGKTFAYNHVLKLHQMAHLGERLYKCTLCAETYSSKKALEAHIKTHGLSPTRQSALSQQLLQQQQQQQLHQQQQQQQQQHSGAAVVSSSAPTPSSSNTPPGLRITPPTCGTGGTDPNPIRRLGQNTSSGGTMVDHTKRNKLVTNNNNHSGAKDVGSRSISLNHSTGSNSCDIVNGIVSSIVESLNPSPPQNQSQQGAWMPSQGQHRLRSDFSLPQNNSGSISGVAQRQRLLADASSSSGSILFGRAATVDSAGNSNSGKGLSNDYQKSQQQQQQQQQLNGLTNGNSRAHQDSGSTYLRPMPPLIPVTAMCSTPIISSLIQSQQPGSKHVQQQLLGGSSSPQFQQEQDFEVYDQRGRPPRKSPRLLKTGLEEGNSNSESDPYSPASSASSSPPLLQLADETTRSAVDEIMLDQALRSTSVIRFAHRPAGSSSSSSSPLPAGSSSQS